MKRPPAKDFRDLIVWQKAHQFVLELYRYSESFPQNEMYGLTQQARRAGISIAANIAEVFKKKTKSEKARFMNIAQGSLKESRYYLILADNMKYGNNPAPDGNAGRSEQVAGRLSRAILDSGS